MDVSVQHAAAGVSLLLGLNTLAELLCWTEVDRSEYGKCGFQGRRGCCLRGILHSRPLFRRRANSDFVDSSCMTMMMLMIVGKLVKYLVLASHGDDIAVT